MSKPFLFRGKSGSSANTETLARRARYGGRKGKSAERRLEEHLSWIELSSLIGGAKGTVTVYVDGKPVLPREKKSL